MLSDEQRDCLKRIFSKLQDLLKSMSTDQIKDLGAMALVDDDLRIVHSILAQDEASVSVECTADEDGNLLGSNWECGFWNLPRVIAKHAECGGRVILTLTRLGPASPDHDWHDRKIERDEEYDCGAGPAKEEEESNNERS